MRSFDCLIRLFETILRSLFSFGICTNDFLEKNICTLCLRLYLIFQNLCSFPPTIIYLRS